MIDALGFPHGHPARRRLDDSPGAGRYHVDRSERVPCVRAMQEYCVAERPYGCQQSKRIRLVGQGKH